MFNKEEKYIADTFGKKTPFSVPNGYFDDLNSRIMRSVGSTRVTSGVIAPATDTAMTVSLWSHYRKVVIGVAASVCVGVFSLGAYLHISDTAKSRQSQVDIAQQSEYSSFDAMVDYSMIDTQDMYAYMTDAQ